MMKPVCLLVAALTAGFACAAETVGFWTFEGTPGQSIADETQIPNKVAGSSLAMYVTRTNYNAAVTDGTPLAKYSDDIPYGYLYNDVRFSNLVANVQSSIRLEVKDYASALSSSAPCLRIDGFNEFAKEGDFTVEMILKTDTADNEDGTRFPTYASCCYLTADGLSADKPAFGFVTCPRKAVAAADGCDNLYFDYTDGTKDDGNGIPPLSPYACTKDGGWHQVALVYVKSSNQFMIYQDYCKTQTRPMSATAASAKTLAFAENGSLYLFGRRGVWPKQQAYYTYAFPSANLLAVRVTRGQLKRRNMLSGSPKPIAEMDGVVAHWKVEGTAGVRMGAEDSLVNPGMGLQLADVGDATTVYTNDTVKPYVQTESGRYTNGVSLTSARLNGARANGLQMRFAEHPLLFSGSFTLEFFFKAHNATVSQCVLRMLNDGRNGMDALALANARLYARSYYVADDGTFTQVSAPWRNPEISLGEWHHIALTYDEPSKTYAFYLDHELVVPEKPNFPNPYVFANVRGMYLPWQDLGTVDNEGNWFYFCRPDGSGNVFGPDAEVDEIRISRRALQPKEFLKGKDRPLGGLLILLK